MDGDGRERDKNDKKLEEEIVGVSKMVLAVNVGFRAIDLSLL